MSRMKNIIKLAMYMFMHGIDFDVLSKEDTTTVWLLKYNVKLHPDYFKDLSENKHYVWI